MSSKSFVLALTLLVLGFSACKKEFDTPPFEDLPNMTATHTIAQLKAMDSLTSSYTQVGVGGSTPANVVIEGIVVGDDRSGNFYKQIVIQDATGGVQVRLNATNTYTDFPVGRKVWIRCDSLYIGRFNGTHQLSYNLNGDAIPETLTRRYVIGGPRNQVITPKVTTIAQLQPEDINTLIELREVEFAAGDLNATFADPIARRTQNRTVRDCNGQTALVRTSGYASFAGVRVGNVAPANGTVRAVYTVFGNERQLYIRDTSDLINMQGQRCTGGGSGGSVVGLNSLRTLHNNGTTTVPAGQAIRAFVISDKDNGNTDGRNLVIQDSSGGITIRFTNNHSFSLGDEVRFEASGASLTDFSGLLQLGNIDPASIQVLSQANSISPRTATIAQITANADAWQSTLVRIVDASLSGGTTFSGSRSMGDGTANITLFTRSQATFAASPLPGGSVEVTGILSRFNSNQISIRFLGDVVGGQPQVQSLISIDSLRRIGVGGSVSNLKIRGVITSDRTTNHIVGQNLTLQDGTAGITLRFSANHNFDLGDSVEVVLTGGSISRFDELLQVQSLSATAVTRLSSGHSVTPLELTIADLTGPNFDNYQSRLVRLTNVSVTNGGNTYSGSLTLSQSGSTIVHFTRTAASFAGQTRPTSSFTLVGLVGQFNTTKQISIRSTADVTP